MFRTPGLVNHNSYLVIFYFDFHPRSLLMNNIFWRCLCGGIEEEESWTGLYSNDLQVPD